MLKYFFSHAWLNTNENNHILKGTILTLKSSQPKPRSRKDLKDRQAAAAQRREESALKRKTEFEQRRKERVERTKQMGQKRQQFLFMAEVSIDR